LKYLQLQDQNLQHRIQCCKYFEIFNTLINSYLTVMTYNITTTYNYNWDLTHVRTRARTHIRAHACVE